MDENLGKSNMEPEAPPEAPKPREPVVFARTDWLALAMGVGLSILWFEVFSFESLVRTPGIGTTTFVLAALAAEAVYLRGKLVLTRGSIFLLAATVLLAVACGLFGDYSVRLINLAMLSFLTPATALALAVRDFPALSPKIIPETLRLFFSGLFRHVAKPFRAVRRGDKPHKTFWVVALTLILMLPLFIVVISLLASADQVFNGLLGGIADALARSLSHGPFVWSWLKIALFGLMLFSFLYSLARPVESKESAPSDFEGFPSLPFIAVLGLLDLIYAVFAGIQFIFLFGGAETAAMHGGYAEYARSGFFQLVAVAGINLLAVLVSVKTTGQGKKAVKILSFTLIGLTVVILASALTRMFLYISVYGLSLLRCETLFLMAWIAVCLAAVAYKTTKPAFKVWPVFFCAFLIGWIIFNYVDIDARIANYNYSAYLAGRLADFDVDYIASLAPGAERLAYLPWPNWYLFH